MADQNKDLKTLRIKSAGLKRIAKEYHAYKQEEEKQNFRIQKLQDQNADEHDVNKQNEVLQETLAMYPNIISRLNDAVNDLQSWMDEKEQDPVISTSEEKVEALETLQNTRDFLKTINPAQ